MVEVSNYSIASLEAYIPGRNVPPIQPIHGSTKRGLIDSGGVLLSTVFYLATQSDVQHVSEGMATLTDGMARNNIVLAK